MDLSVQVPDPDGRASNRQSSDPTSDVVSLKILNGPNELEVD